MLYETYFPKLYPLYVEYKKTQIQIQFFANFYLYHPRYKHYLGLIPPKHVFWVKCIEEKLFRKIVRIVSYLGKKRNKF